MFHTKLRRLEVQDNKFGGNFGKGMGTYLKVDATLEYLDFSGNLVGRDGAKEIGRALCECSEKGPNKTG